MLQPWFSVLVWILVLGVNSEQFKKAIKGQQYVRQIATARLVGGPVPPDLLFIIQNNVSVPNKYDSEPSADQRRVPHLITDEVKTTITRMVIPLITSYSDSERYLEMLRKFLLRNNVNLTHVDRLESPGELAPSTSAVAFKLQAAANLKANMISVLSSILAVPESGLPEGHRAPISIIHRLLQLRRIPVIDLLEYVPKLIKATAQEQWITLFSELEKHIPPYFKSCVTFLLESMQERTLNMDEIISSMKDGSSHKILTSIPYQGGPYNPVNKPLLFPRRILTKMKRSYEEVLGRTLAAMLTTVTENRRHYSPRLLALFLLHLPRNTPNAQHDEKLFSIVNSQDAVFPAEVAAVAEAFDKALPMNSTASEIFLEILRKVVEKRFIGSKRYEDILNEFQLPTDYFIL